MTDFKETLFSILKSSELIQNISGINLSLNERGNPSLSRYRNLTPDEINRLKAQNNHAENWENILVANGFVTTFISNCRFYGKCYIGKLTGFPLEIENKSILQSGIYDSIIKDSVIDDESLVCRCGLVSNCIVSPYTVLFNCGTITASSANTFGNGIDTIIGPETGERGIKIYSEMTMEVSESLLIQENRKLYDSFIPEYISRCTVNSGFIGRNCRIINTVSVSNSFINDTAVISGASVISNSTILSSEKEETFIGQGVHISDSSIQWGCSIDSMSVIQRSLVMEHSHAEKHCNITDSIIGPDSAIGEAEITSSLAGPFTASHHHSLLIACIWPGGRGNIGYGANVGSNHTSRLPDQEIIPGEGMFFGLGSSVKFPAEYRKSPYTVISTGTVTLPQRVEFPFSLITQNSHYTNDIPPSYNELIPAWGLSGNIYSAVRNESKYRSRKRSRRNESDFSIFRPEIIDMMIAARERLAANVPDKQFYTEEDIAGTGKNYITSKSRLKGIETYTFYIQFYALKQMVHRAGKILSENKGIDTESVYRPDEDIRYWSHAMSVLANEGLRDLPLKENFERLMAQNDIFLSSVYSSRDKDFTRGNRIISGYSEYHSPTGGDRFIIELKNKTVIEQTRLEQMLNLL